MFFNDSNINLRIQQDLNKHISSIYGFDVTYAYGIVDKNDLSRTSVISNLNEWYGNYAQRDLQEVDPVVRIAMGIMTDFVWSREILISAGYSLPAFYDEAAAHGITQGHTFVTPDHHGNIAMLTFMTTLPGVAERVYNDRKSLHWLLVETHEKLTAMYLLKDPKKVPQALTNRERELLYLVSIGKEYQEAATLLNIKEHSVRFHLAKAAQKLGAKNTRHAIRIAMEFNMIDSLP